MLQKISRQVWFAVLLMILSVVCTTAVANTRVYIFISEVVSTIETKVLSIPSEENNPPISYDSNSNLDNIKSSDLTISAPMFVTIIQGADEEVECDDDGSTLAKFFLCGINDDRTVTVSGGGTIEWQQRLTSCTLTGANDCPVNNTACWPVTSTTSSTFFIDASNANVATEYRVRADGGQWYYFRVSQSTINQTSVVTPFVCGVNGRIQITGLSSAYEYSIDGGVSWQGPIFDNLTPGTYNILARQQGVSGACEYPYAPIEILTQDIAFDVSFVDAQCSGDTGSVTVNVNNTVPGPYKYTLLDTNGVPQEFTAFLPADNYTFSAVGFGSYMVQVETQQCSGDPANGIDPPRENVDINGNPIIIGNGLNALDASTEVNSSFGCSTITSVDITLNASGGSAPYTYTVNGGPVQPSFTGSTTYVVTSAAGAGSYDFIVTDSNGCSITASSNVESLAPPTVNATGVDGTCTNGGARINFDVSNANGYNLSYRVNTGDPWDTNPSISVPAAPGGTAYTGVSVRYQQGGFECTMDLPDITVTSLGVIAGTATKIADRTCDGTGGTIGGRIDFGPASGGSSSGYVFSIDGQNFSAITSYPNLVAGMYTPMIEDDGGCRLVLTAITILDIDPPTDINFVPTNSNCATNTVDIQVVPTSNAPIANFSIISPITINNGGNDTFTNVDASQSYIFQITDDNNCTYTEAYTPTVISTIRARVKSGGNTQICTGDSDGSGAFLIDGFANTYSYQIGANPIVTGQTASEVPLNSLGAATYSITITDEITGCTDTASFTVQEPAIALSLLGTVTPMTCNNGNLGRVRANPTGGWGNNRYTLTYPNGTTTVGPKSGPTFGGLSIPSTPGNPYTLTVVDAEGCTASFTFDLTIIDAPTIALDRPSSDFCYDAIPGGGATLVATSTAGSAAIGTHQYRIDGGPLQASATFTNLGPGNHVIQVVDGNSCSDTVDVTIGPPLRANASIAAEIDCGSLPGGIRVEVTGGYLSSTTLPKTFEYSTDNGTTYIGPFNVPSSNIIAYSTNFPATYIFRVSDNEGCTAISEPITLNPPNDLLPATVNVTPASCGETNNGIATIIPDASSGIPPYEISFNGGAFGSQSTFSNLIAGNSYPYIVRDFRGCVTAADSALIPLDSTSPPTTTLNEIQGTCSAGNAVAGGIQITNVVDGFDNFTFVVEDILGTEVTRREGVTRASLPININDPSLVPGTYTVVTFDANGCSSENTVTITTGDISITPINFTPATTCDDSAFTYTVQVTPTIFPTIPTYQIRLAGQSAFYALNNSSGADTHTFSNTADGIEYGVEYTVEVLAPNGCMYQQIIPPVDGFSPLDVTTSSTPDFCDVNRNGQIEYTITGFTLGDNLQVEILDNDTSIRTILETVTPGVDPYVNTTLMLPGDYQIIVTNLTDDCTEGAGIIVNQNLPSIYVLNRTPANCSADGSITVQGNGGSGGPYTFAFIPTTLPQTPVTAGDFNTVTTYFGPAGGYDIYLQDALGCRSFANADIIPLDPALLAPTFAVGNQCAVASPTFDIVVSVPASVNTPRFTLGGDSQFGVLNGGGTAWEYTYVVTNPGDYLVDVIDANGCTSQGTAVVYEFLSASGGFTTDSTCNNADGEITIVPLGGSGNFDYALTGTDYLGASVTMNLTNITGDGIFSAVTPGSYQVLVTDRQVTDGVTNCSFTVNNINLEEVDAPSILPIIPELITCFGVDDGAIEVVLAGGTDTDGPIDYRLLNAGGVLITNNASGSFTGLGVGTYQVEAVSARNCRDVLGPFNISAPPAFEISAIASAFLCEPGANRFNISTITVDVHPTNIGTPTNYRYSITGFENYQTSNIFEIIDNGSPQNIIIYAIDDNGCQTQFNVPTILPPSLVNPVMNVVNVLNCSIDERVRISVPELTDFTVLTASAVAVAPVTNASGVTEVFIDLPEPGDYLFTIQDNSPDGCSYPMPIHTVIAPIQPTVVIAEAAVIGCFTASDGELSIEVTNYTGLYSYEVFRGDDILKANPIASGVNLDTANNPELITGLPGGNFFVEITSTATPFCSAESNVATIRTPNGELLVTAVEIGNVSCNDNTGIIEATGVGGWDTSAYEYRLLFDDGSGYQEVVAFGSNHIFDVLDNGNGLSSGDYQVEIRDIENCPSTFNINLPIVPQIDAGIREPLALQCPNGNNAVLEAYDPTSGDVITAAAGATGGFLNAGYTYRLLYLNGTDINVQPLNSDIASTSGLQNTPTFIGASGGFISEGWYAIEVTSSFSCEFVTEPYYVVPPPPIEPRLVQTRVPGCGGIGQIRLFIDNHDPVSNFEYEYRTMPTPNPTTDPWIDMGVGITELFFDVPGSPSGINYQYEVRKKNSGITCLPINTSGITLTDASNITLAPNDINPISCAFQVDGRAESFASGGVGNNQYYLYQGNPGNPFSPSPSALLIQGPQALGTFEEIPEGTDYYIAVTSGSACSDVSDPFDIISPEAIIPVATPIPTTCNGGDDGQINISVTSGGEGLISFAIAPNFNEFLNDPTTPGNYTFDGLVAGTYEVLIQDESGCFVREMVEVTEPDVISAAIVELTPETCINFADGTAQLSVTGGTPFVDSSTLATYYETRLVGPDSDGSELFVRNDNLFFDNLVGGETYIIFIRDAGECIDDIIVPIEIGVDLTAGTNVDYGCDGIFPNSTATVIMQDPSLLPELLFALDPLDPADAITSNAGTETTWGNLPMGDHIVYIYHENGCTDSVTFTTLAYEPLTLTAEKTGPNEVTAFAEGGFGNYEFFFQGESTGTETVFTTNQSTVVNVQVRDEGGCVANITVPFEFTGMLEIPNFFTPDGDNNNDLWAPNNREFFPNIEVKIYDRYGRVVAILDQITKWNGKYEGSELPTGDYWYVVNANDINQMRYVGHFTLYR